MMSDRQPLRFCIVTTFYPPYNFGGDGIYAHRLANALARRGHRVTVLHSPSAYELGAGGPPIPPMPGIPPPLPGNPPFIPAILPPLEPAAPPGG